MPSAGTSATVNFTGSFSIDSYRLDGGQKATNGWCYLPGGMQMCWGRTTISGNSTSSSINFQHNFSGNPYSIVITPEATTTGNMDGWSVTKSSPSTSSFKITNAYGTSTVFNWIAIGSQT